MVVTAAAKAAPEDYSQEAPSAPSRPAAPWPSTGSPPCTRSRRPASTTWTTIFRSNRHLVAVLLIEGSLSPREARPFSYQHVRLFSLLSRPPRSLQLVDRCLDTLRKRFRFQNGEHHSRAEGTGRTTVHAVTLFLQKFRKRGRAANTIHAVCQCLALLYRELDANLRVDIRTPT